MGKFIKLFESHSQYEAYINGQDAVLPNVSYCIDNDEVHYNPWVDSRLSATYTVADDTNPTQLYTYLSEGGMTIDGATMFDKVEIDGTEVSIADLDTAQGAYQLTAGGHTVKYTLKDPTIIGLFMDESTGTMTVGATFYAMCPALTSVTIPNSVTSIGQYAFNTCTSLTSITIPNSVTTIGEYAFDSCSSLTSVTIPNSVTSIGISAFSGCSSLTSVTIGNSVTSISNRAFSGCSSLTSITIPDSVTSIGGSAFESCTSLTSVTIPDSVTSIGNGAFCNCNLASVTIGSGITSIDTEAFNPAIVESCTIKATIPPTLGENVFNPQGEDKFYVPAQSLNAYKTASGWSEYAEYIFPIGG